MSHRLCLAISTGLIAACSGTLPVPSSRDRPQPAPRVRDEVSHERVAAISGVALIPDSGVRHYLTTSTTVLRLESDTEPSQAVITTALGFSVAYSRASSSRTRITGTLTQMIVTTEGSSPAPDQPPLLPLKFTGYLEHGGFHLDSLAGSPPSTVPDCQAAGLSGIAGIQRNFVVPPLLLSTGTTWTDSSTVPVCSGSVQLALTAVRTYTVAGQTMRGLQPVIVVDRKDRTRTAGQGAQGQHGISILSEGSGSARIYLDRTTGLLRESEGAQAVDLVIGSSGRSQRFRQVAEERTHLQ